MEHLIVTNLDEGHVKIVAEEGYRLFDARTNRFYSEAMVKEQDVKYFKGVL